MSSNANTFIARLRLYSEETVPEIAKARVRAVGLDMARGVVELTPVDTGRLKGNWQPTLDSPAEGEIERLDPTAEGVSGSSPAFVDAVAVLAQIQLGQMFWLHNGVPYAVHQEHGRPGMEGRHMVARTIARLERSYGG